MSEWVETTLGAITTQRKGINYKSEDYCPDGSGHPFITIKCFQKGGGYETTGIKFYDGGSTKADQASLIGPAPKWPMSAYRASAPVTHRNTPPKTRNPV